MEKDDDADLVEYVSRCCSRSTSRRLFPPPEEVTVRCRLTASATSADSALHLSPSRRKLGRALPSLLLVPF
jgi:hypothetical protein